jgi:hypothetical protein
VGFAGALFADAIDVLFLPAGCVFFCFFILAIMVVPACPVNSFLTIVKKLLTGHFDFIKLF